LQLRPITSRAPLVEIVVEDKDWEVQSPEILLWIAQQIILIRRFEERVLRLKDQDLVYGPVHTSIGQEAVAAGVASALRAGDKISGSHRAHHHYLAKVLSALRPADYNPLRDGLTLEMKHAVEVLLAEIMGLSEGCCGGRGGSMHLYHAAGGVIGTNAIVAGGVPHATGAAWADKYLGHDNVTVCFFGEGGIYQGVVHESSNLAALWRAPIIYLIENNQYSVATTPRESCSASIKCAVGAAYDMPAMQVDGMDPLAVKLAVEHAVSTGRTGLPCYLETQTYRYFHHAGKLAGSAYGYRDKAEEIEWRKRDPLELCIRQLTRLGLLDEERRQLLVKNADECLEEAVAHCTETQRDGTVIVRESLWPDAASLTDGLRDDAGLAGGPFLEAEEVECSEEIRYSDAIAGVTGRWLEKDPCAVVIGEDVANLGGGAYGATKGLAEKFPGRVRNTPISEAGFSGLACGAAMNGLHPVVEIMFSSFVLVAADQLLNQIGQLRHIYGGNVDMPVVVRTRVAAGLGYGVQHSLDPVALFSLFPGWRIFVPTTPFDYIGLFNAAMHSKSPTLIVEQHEFYAQRGKIPAGPADYLVRPGRAKIVRQGEDATVVAYGYMVTLALEAARQLEAEGVRIEVIDLRTLDEAALDYESIGKSLKKTNVLVTADQAPATNSVGPKIAAECLRRFFYDFEIPPGFVTGPNVSIPVSRRLEKLCLPGASQIAETVRAVLRRR
jgi:2-oxoisovalerate dehydrogenase E1 component